MGLFVLPTKRKDECTALELVEAAEENLRLWKENADCTYLLTSFAVPMLEAAAAKAALHNTEAKGPRSGPV